MKYNKTYYIIKRSGKDDYRLEKVNASVCPYDKRLFITKETYGKRWHTYTLNDIKSGKSLATKNTLQELKDWFLNGGKKAYLKVIKQNLFNYQRDLIIFKRLKMEAF